MYITIKRKRTPNKITEAEFKLTKQFMDILGLYTDSDFYMYQEWDDIYDKEIYCGNQRLCYCEHYGSIYKIPQSMTIFRPFINEKHADIIIKLFEETHLIDFDTLEINECEKNNKKYYSGWLTDNGVMIENSFVKQSPSPAILKMSIMAMSVMDEVEHGVYITNLLNFLRR